MDAQLLLWIVDQYTAEGETILDPMGGSGTAMLACTLGRNVIMVELEAKFIEMQRANWEKVRMMPQLGCQMGDCLIVQGDARNLGDVLADHAIFSPPFAETVTTRGKKGERADNLSSQVDYDCPQRPRYPNYRDISTRTRDGLGRWVPMDGHTENNISNLPYGDIDSIITSPPHGGAGEPFYSPAMVRIRQEIGRDTTKPSQQTDGYGNTPGQVGQLPYGAIDSIVTSPPYDEGGGHGRGQRTDIVTEKRLYTKGAGMYSESKENIGEMRGESYLSAMLQVYQQCHAVLKAGGLMILVTKNFIRNKQEVRLDEDTIKLCEEAGFRFRERHYRKLPAQSFWRVIYQQKYPDAPVLDKEDVLVFEKAVTP